MINPVKSFLTHGPLRHAQLVRNIHITFHLKFFRVNRQYRRDLAGEYTEKVTFFPRLSPSRVSRAPLRASLKNAEKKNAYSDVTLASLTDFARGDDELLASVPLSTTLLEHFPPHCQRMISLQREKKNLGDHYIGCHNLLFVNPA